jgi:RNA polymerase sigma-70 factor (sigma-E family)
VDFEEYVQDHAFQLARLAAVVCCDRGAGEDVVQEVLIRAHDRWPKIQDLSYPHAYIRRMVINEATSWRRRLSRVEPRADVGLDLVAPVQAGQFENRDQLRTEIAKLSPKVRAALVLRYFEDLPDADIAELLSCRAVTVRGYIHRGLAALRIELAPNPGPRAEARSRSSLTRKVPR